MKDSVRQKYIAIHKRYTELYVSKRKRIDDVITQLSEEFFLTESWIERILKIELSDHDNEIEQNN